MPDCRALRGPLLFVLFTAVACSNSTAGPGDIGGRATGGSQSLGGATSVGGGGTSSSAGGAVGQGGQNAIGSGGRTAGGSGGIGLGGQTITGFGGGLSSGGQTTSASGGAAAGGRTTSSDGSVTGGQTAVGSGGSAGGDTAGSGGAIGAGGMTTSGGRGGADGDAGTILDAPRSAGDAAADSAMDAPVSIQGPQTFHCVNWADPRDNYVNGLLALSGLSATADTYATVASKANDILSEFQTKLGANAIRIPINEPTVSGAWWNAYKAVIDTAVGKGMKVIVGYWAYQNGKPDDATAWKTMWQTVVTAYQSNNLVYFDIHNEPYGYGSGWNDVAAQWLADFPTLPKGRVIVAGTGYDDKVVPVGSDARFAGCILQLHIYGFWHTSWTTQAQWTASMNTALGSYAARTLVGEWGAPMTTGTDYSVNTDGNVYRSYVRAVADLMRSDGMGSCYWPGLRNGDSYSMTTLSTGGPPLTLTVTNTSGLDRVHWAWQL